MTVNIKWDYKEMKTGKETEPLSINEQMLECVYHMREEGRDGETKKEYEARIYAKVQMGKKLTPDELSFLARTNPVLYQKAMRVQIMRRMLENRLKSCKSKQEAQEVFSAAISGISENDPDKEILVAALEDVYMEFKKSDAYKKLPLTEEETEKKSGGNVAFDVDESGYWLVYAQDSGSKAFVVNA